MLDELKKLIKEVMPEIDMDTVSEDTKLVEDLHFDSLAIMMLAMSIETEYGIQFSEAINFVTVKDVLKYIEENK